MSVPADDDVAAYLGALRAGRVDPREGLPDPVFQFALAVVPMVNVDLLIQDEKGRSLVAWRDDPFGTGWHIPGGIVRYRETLAARIEAVARLELGATVRAASEPCRVSQLPDSGRGHFISLLFRCELCEPIDDRALFDVSASPQAGRLQWSVGVPEPLYPAHDIYRDLFRR